MVFYSLIPLQVGPSPLLVVLAVIFLVIVPVSTLWYVWQMQQRLDQMADELDRIEHYLER